MPDIPQPEYHFTSYKNGFLEAFTFDPARPTSLLYKKTSAGYELVGAMYTMPKRASEDQLNVRVPLSIASWHLHIQSLFRVPRPAAIRRLHQVRAERLDRRRKRAMRRVAASCPRFSAGWCTCIRTKTGWTKVRKLIT